MPSSSSLAYHSLCVSCTVQEAHVHSAGEKRDIDKHRAFILKLPHVSQFHILVFKKNRWCCHACLPSGGPPNPIFPNNPQAPQIKVVSRYSEDGQSSDPIILPCACQNPFLLSHNSSSRLVTPHVGIISTPYQCSNCYSCFVLMHMQRKPRLQSASSDLFAVTTSADVHRPELC